MNICRIIDAMTVSSH